MTSRTHIARQEEFVDEVGIQLRADDPATPTQDQVWLNTYENRLKARVGGVTRVYYDSLATGSMEVPGTNVIDGNKSYNYFKTLIAETTLTFENMHDGMPVRLLLENFQTNSYRTFIATLPPSTLMNAGNYWYFKTASNMKQYHVWYDFNGSGANEPVLLGSTPVRVIMTSGRKEKSTIKMKSPAGNSLAGMFIYAKIYNASNTEYYIWWNIDGSGGDPFPPAGDPNEIMVTASSSNTAENMASLTAQAINNAGYGFVASVSGDTVTIENASNGFANDISIGVSDPGASTTTIIDSVAVVTQGAAPDSAEDIATLTAAAINALAEVDAVASGPDCTVTYTEYGSADAPQNGNVPSGLSFLVTAQGSGPIRVNFPVEVKFEEGLTPNVMPPLVERLYEFVKIGSSIVCTYTDFV